MIVAVIAMMTVKAPLVKLILVVAVRDHGMVAVLGGLSIMHVPRVLRASMVRRAPIRVPLADLDAMGDHDVALLMFEAVFVQVIDVIAVANGRMPASRSVLMCHDRLLSYLCAHNNERPTPCSRLKRLDIVDIRQRPIQCLSPCSDGKTRLTKQQPHVRDGVKRRILIEDALGAVGHIVLAEWAVPVDESNNQRAHWAKNATRLGQHGLWRVDEADRRHDEAIVEALAREGQGFGGACYSLDPATIGASKHLQRRIDTDLYAKRSSESRGADADFYPASFPGNERAERQQFGYVGSLVFLEPPIVPLVMDLEWSRSRHRSSSSCHMSMPTPLIVRSGASTRIEGRFATFQVLRSRQPGWLG
jgi:hypothetical protein